MVLEASLAPETSGTDGILPASFAGPWALVCRELPPGKVNMSPTPAWTSHQGHSLGDKSVGLQPRSADFFPPSHLEKRSGKFLCSGGKAGRHDGRLSPRTYLPEKWGGWFQVFRASPRASLGFPGRRHENRIGGNQQAHVSSL